MVIFLDKENKLIALLALYVDDILITGLDNEIKYIIEKLKGKYRISKEANAEKIIGFNIEKTKNGYKINQKDYIDKLISKYNMNKIKILKYPCRKINEKERENSPS